MKNTETPIIEFKQLVENNKKITPNKFNNLKNRNCVVGNPEDLVHIDWSEQWKPLISYDY